MGIDLEKPVDVSPFSPWRSVRPIVAPPQVVDLEAACRAVNHPFTYEVFQHKTIGSCGPNSMGGAMERALANQILQGNKSVPWMRFSPEWICGLARNNVPGSEREGWGGGTDNRSLSIAVRQWGVLPYRLYPEDSTFLAFSASRCGQWGDKGVPAWSLKYPTVMADLLAIQSDAELLSAIACRVGIVAIGKWNFTTTEKGIITNPQVSPTAIKPGESPAKLWQHAMGIIGCKQLKGRCHIAFRNHMNTAQMRGTGDPDFKWRGQGLIPLESSLVQQSYKYGVWALVNLRWRK